MHDDANTKAEGSATPGLLHDTTEEAAEARAQLTARLFRHDTPDALIDHLQAAADAWDHDDEATLRGRVAGVLADHKQTTIETVRRVRDLLAAEGCPAMTPADLAEIEAFRRDVMEPALAEQSDEPEAVLWLHDWGFVSYGSSRRAALRVALEGIIEGWGGWDQAGCPLTESAESVFNGWPVVLDAPPEAVRLLLKQLASEGVAP